MFCLLCNSEEKLYDGLCKNCYLKEFEIIKVPKYATFTVCSHCGATLKHEKWIESAYYDDEIINDAIKKDIEVNDKIEDLSISTSIISLRQYILLDNIEKAKNVSVVNNKLSLFSIWLPKNIGKNTKKFFSH